MWNYTYYHTFCGAILWANLGVSGLERSRNRQRQTKQVRLEAVAQRQQSGGHAVAHTLVGGHITRGEKRLPEDDQNMVTQWQRRESEMKQQSDNTDCFQCVLTASLILGMTG